MEVLTVAYVENSLSIQCPNSNATLIMTFASGASMGDLIGHIVLSAMSTQLAITFTNFKEAIPCLVGKIGLQTYHIECN